MKKLIIPPVPEALGYARDPAQVRAQGDEPHAAAQEGVRISSDWRLFADGQEVPVYAAPVTRGGPHSFAQLCYEGDEPIELRAVRKGGMTSVELLPKSYGLQGKVEEDAVCFPLDRTGHVTILVDGGIEQPLTISVNPVRAVKAKGEVKGLYFGPGLHEIDTFDFEDGDTIYLAPGAVVTARPHGPEEEPVVKCDWAGQQIFRNCILAVKKKNVSIEGMGILDFSLLHWHERSPVVFSCCENVTVRDVTFVNVPAWTVNLSGCIGAEVDNVKLFGYRENSDGIDIVSSQHIRVHDSFIRTGDDAVVVKAMIKPPVCGGKDIVCERCIVWNDKVRCFGIAAESVNDICDVRFSDCDVLRSFADWTLEVGALAVYISDKALVNNVLFENIRIEHEVHLASIVMVAKDFWSKDLEAGNIRNVVFRDISIPAGVESRVLGYDAQHTVEDVTYQRLSVGGKLAGTLEEAGIVTGEYTSRITVTRE